MAEKDAAKGIPETIPAPEPLPKVESRPNAPQPGAIERQVVALETNEKTDAIRMDLAERGLSAVSALGPQAEKGMKALQSAFDTASKQAGKFGSVTKMFETFKTIMEKLEPFQERLAKMLGPVMGAEVPEVMKGVLSFSSLGMVPLLERFTGSYGVFYRKLSELKITVNDPQFSAKKFLALHAEGTAKGMQLPMDAFVMKVAAQLRKKKNAGPAMLNATGKEIEEAAKEVTDREISTDAKSTVPPAEKKPEQAANK
jgi:hypothetical protein